MEKTKEKDAMIRGIQVGRAMWRVLQGKVCKSCKLPFLPGDRILDPKVIGRRHGDCKEAIALKFQNHEFELDESVEVE